MPTKTLTSIVLLGILGCEANPLPAGLDRARTACTENGALTEDELATFISVTSDFMESGGTKDEALAALTANCQQGDLECISCASAITDYVYGSN